jgi:hypothetical protein
MLHAFSFSFYKNDKNPNAGEGGARVSAAAEGVEQEAGGGGVLLPPGLHPPPGRLHPLQATHPPRGHQLHRQGFQWFYSTYIDSTWTSGSLFVLMFQT